ncbi:MAG TPA: hypothetical protein VJT81_19875 [Burkholderiales bacterium]|nr:hypothetical protein [Burkholderiales bacterium]
MPIDNLYEKSLRHGLEYIHTVAARRGWNKGTLMPAFDVGRVPGTYQEHTLRISLGEIHVSTEGIPHEWIEIGTGFIDTRFSQRIAALLSELQKKLTGV